MDPLFDLQGHRGARGLFPENTLEGLAAAARAGISSFEIDIGLSRDGVPVLHHDPALNPDLAREPGGAWITQPIPLRELPLSELQRYDVGRIRSGSDYAARFPEQRPLDGARIPTLAAALGAQPQALFNIEIKALPDQPELTATAEEMADRVLRVIREADAASRVIIQSFDWRAPRFVTKVQPDIPRGWLTAPETIAAAPLWLGLEPGTTLAALPAAIAAEGGGTWTPWHEDLTDALVDEAHGNGLRVIPWTVNAESDMRRLVAIGVNGLITDYPDRLPRDL